MENLPLEIKKLITTRLNLRMDPDSISNEAPLFGTADGGIGLDSIDALDLAVGLFEEFHIEIGEQDMHIFANVNSVVAFIEKAKPTIVAESVEASSVN
jgi:acyl carrier protein